MSSSLTHTFQWLARTTNRAAVEVLIAGLDCSHPATRDLALRALLDRPDPAGHHEVFRRLKNLDGHCREIVSQRPDRLARVAGDALRSADKRACEAACETILAFRLYEVLPEMVGQLNRPEHPHVPTVARLVLQLTERFYGELCGPNGQAARRGLETLRRHVTAALESGVRKFHVHRRREVIEAFLLIAKQQNVVLRHVFAQPRDPACQAILEILSTSAQGGVIRLLLSFLEDPMLPQGVKHAITHRTDLRFVKRLLEAVAARSSHNVDEMLSRIEQLAWAEPGHELLPKLDEQGQRNVVDMVLATSIPKGRVLKLLGWLLLEGNAGGRRAAAEALAGFPGCVADALVVKALNDKDPMVRASLIRQIRPRNIPGALALLVRMVDVPDALVREALRESMPEFTVQRFMANFDALPDRYTTAVGNLVRKIHPDAAALLRREMQCLSPVRRRRAVQAAGAMGLVRELEHTVLVLLTDEDHMVRIEAAKALADCDTMPTWDALRDALLDRSVVVQEAAGHSLEQISRSLLRDANAERASETAVPEEVPS